LKNNKYYILQNKPDKFILDDEELAKIIDEAIKEKKFTLDEINEDAETF
jgi:ferredoxin